MRARERIVRPGGHHEGLSAGSAQSRNCAMRIASDRQFWPLEVHMPLDGGPASSPQSIDYDTPNPRKVHLLGRWHDTNSRCWPATLAAVQTAGGAGYSIIAQLTMSTGSPFARWSRNILAKSIAVRISRTVPQRHCVVTARILCRWRSGLGRWELITGIAASAAGGCGESCCGRRRTCREHNGTDWGGFSRFVAAVSEQFRCGVVARCEQDQRGWLVLLEGIELSTSPLPRESFSP